MPPEPVTITAPLASPLQVIFVCEVIATPGLGFTTTPVEALAVHKNWFVIVTLYVPFWAGEALEVTVGFCCDELKEGPVQLYVCPDVCPEAILLDDKLNENPAHTGALLLAVGTGRCFTVTVTNNREALGQPPFTAPA